MNGDGSGLLTVPIKYPSEAKESIQSSEAEKLGQTSYESSSTSKSGEARSEFNCDGSILFIGDSIIKILILGNYLEGKLKNVRFLESMPRRSSILIHHKLFCMLVRICL